MTYNLTKPGFLRANHHSISLTTRALPWIALAVCAAFQGRAQEPAPSPSPALSGSASPTLLQEVVVTATRTDETADKVTSSYTKIDANEIQRDQFTNTKQAVNVSPGVIAREQGAEGGLTTVSIRGNRSVDTLFLVDGMKSDSVFFGNGGSPLMSFASNLNLSAVEVVRGPHSALFGPEAMGGVVSMETTRGSGTPSAMLFFEGGSFDTFREGIVSGGSLGALDYSFHYAREDSNNDRINNQLGVNSGSLRLDYTVNDRLTVGATMRTQDGDYHEPGTNRPLDYGFNDPNAATHQEATTVTTYAELKACDNWITKLTLGTYQERYVLNDPFNPASYLGTVMAPSWTPVDWTWANPYVGSFAIAPDYSNTYSHTVLESANWFADWKNTIQLSERNRLVTGASLLYQTGNADYYSDYVVNYPYAYESLYQSSSHGSATDMGIYAEDQWEIIDHLTLMGSLRYDHDQLSGIGTGEGNAYDLSANPFTYRLGAAYLLEPTHTKFHTSIGTGFKEPTINQLSTTAAANGHILDPEHSQSWDAGVDQYFLGDRLSLGATFFQNRIDNLITYLNQPAPRQGYYANAAEALSHGIETSLTAKFNDHWQARLSYTWTESEQSKTYWDDLNEIQLTGLQRAVRIPRHVLSAETNYTFDLPVGKLTLGAGAFYAAQRDDVDWAYAKPIEINGQMTYAGKLVSMPDYVTFRAYGRYALNERVAFTARVENLTNADYQPVLGYPALGRAYYGGMEIKF